MRREFVLPEEDVDYLDSTGYFWETIKTGMMNWVIINDYSVPEGYNIKKVNLALRIDHGYPVSQIDMVYFYPHLQITKGVQPAALSNQLIDGKNWQRWSRHRTGQNPWRAGIDNILTHLQMVSYWLERELNK